MLASRRPAVRRSRATGAPRADGPEDLAIAAPVAGHEPDRAREHLFMVFMAVGCGLAGAFAAIAFRVMIRMAMAVFWGGQQGLQQMLAAGWLADAGDPLAMARALPWYWSVIVPTLGGLVVGPIIYFFAREAKGYGVPEVIKSVLLRGGVIRPRIVMVKALASAICIGSGGSVGREGPIVQMGSAIGSAMGQWLRVPARQLRTIVGCGSAAGIAATFNAPIAGALFATEVVVGDFAVTQFSPIVISSVVATVVSRFFLGNHPAFVLPPFEIVSPFELAPYMVIGAIAGLVGVAFIYTLSFSEGLFDRVPAPEWSKAAIGGLCVGTLGIGLPQVFGVGYASIGDALHGSIPATLLGVLVVAKIAATTITIGSGGSGGIFAPSLFMGAMTGGFLGDIVHRWFPDATASPGAYGLVTMGAVVGATTHAPISSMIIIFEMTGQVEIIPALMAACVLSSLVSQLLSRDSIYTIKLTRQGIDVFQAQDPNPLKNLFVRDIMDHEPEVVPAAAGFQTILDLVVRSDHGEFFVVDGRSRLLGAISLSEVRRLIYEREALQDLVVASDLVDARRPTVSEQDDLDVVMRLFSRSGIDEIAVVDRADPTRLVGSVREKDVIEARNREMLRRDLSGGIASSVIAVGRGHRVDLGGGFALEEVVAPPSVFGHTLREIDLRARTGVHVLLIRRGRSGSPDATVRVPGADDVIREGDALVVAGDVESLERLQVLQHLLADVRHVEAAP